MAFVNRIRLPFEIVKPQFPEEKSVYRKANGETKTLSVVVRKTYEGQTDYFPEKWHERLKMALAHDNVAIEGDKYLGGVSQDGDYNIEWVDFLDYPTAPAKFKVQVTPFEAFNSNCQTCDTALQLNLVDDYYNDVYGDPIALQEGNIYELDVKDNDDIRCYPAVFSVVTYNSDFLTNATIDQNGVLTITLGTGLNAGNGIALATYRVTCPDGAYDEAVVYGNVDGTVVVCLAPTSIAVTGSDSTTASIEWEPPIPAPAGYNWQLEDITAMGVIVQSGSTALTSITLTGLTPGTTYVFSVQSDCTGTESSWITVNVSTIPTTTACGTYNLIFSPASGDSSQFAMVSYIDCNAVYQTVILFPNIPRNICALQTIEGQPNFIEGATYVNYTGLC